jgi:cation:H+ antiporter
MPYFYLILGLVLLLVGGEWLVRGAVDLALRLKVSTLVIGMTVVSFATSAPELLVSVGAAMNGYTDISFGNVVGSNLANIALILGLTALVFPMSVKEKTYRVDFWIMMAVTLVLFLFVFFDSVLNFWEALVLAVLLLLYNVFQIRSSRKSFGNAEPELEVDATEPKKGSPFKMIFFLSIGVASLKFGSEFLIDGAVELAESWGVSERVIGITVVSIGTSLPELAASMVASFKGEQELSLGNLIGSNIFNILAVLGLTGLVIELPVKSEALLNFDFPFLFATSIVLFLFIRVFTKGKITRWQGGVMLAIYLAYIFSVL